MNKNEDTARAIVIVTLIIIVGFLVWQYLEKKQDQLTNTPSHEEVLTATSTKKIIPLILSEAECGNWVYTAGSNVQNPWTWTSQQSCADHLYAKDGQTFEIKQEPQGQSVAQIYFDLPDHIDASEVTSLEGEVVGVCRRQFELKTETKYGEWKPIGLMQCHPDYGEDISYKFSPEIHNGKVGILIVSGDNLNRLVIDQVSVTATYTVPATTTSSSK